MLRWYIYIFFFRTALYGRDLFLLPSPSPPPEICVDYEQWRDCLSKSCWMLIWRHELSWRRTGPASSERDRDPRSEGSLLTPSHHACAAFFGGMISATLYFNPATLTRPAGQQPLKYNVSVVDFSFSLFGGRGEFLLVSFILVLAV